MPDLSIVIISYNTSKLTAECLESVFGGLGGLRAEVIVVDNNSADDTVAMIRSRFPEVNLIVNGDNRGFAAANNQGFAIAKGRYVLLLNSDTLVLGRVLEKSVAYMKANPSVGAFGCRVLNTDGTTQRTCSGYPTVGRLLAMTLGLDRILPRLDRYRMLAWDRRDERDVDVVTGCYLMLPREVISAVGGLDEQFFFFGEETDWCRRIHESGWKVRFAPVGEIIHHGGGSVKKLNFKRDVMLTAATVRLHRKNGGTMAAVAAFAVLAMFNASRALLWSGRSLFSPGAGERASHFRKVCANTAATWPKAG